MFRLRQSRLLREPTRPIPQDLPALNTHRNRHRKGSVLPTYHRETIQQQSRRQAKPPPHPPRRLRRPPEPRAPRRALRHTRNGRRAPA
jgi:hypothetical protein